MSLFYYPKPFNSEKFLTEKDKTDNLYNLIMACTEETDWEDDLNFQGLVYYPKEKEASNFSRVLFKCLELENGEEEIINILKKISNYSNSNLKWEDYEPFVGYITYEEVLKLKEFFEGHNFKDKIAEDYRNFLLSLLTKVANLNRGIILLAL